MEEPLDNLIEELAKKPTEKKKFSLAIGIGISVMLLGVMLFIAHYPFATPTILIGEGLIAVFYSLRFISKKEKDAISLVKLILVLSYCVGAALGILHWPYRTLIGIINSIALLAWVILEIFHYYKFGKFSISLGVKKISLLSIGAVLIIVGAMFKIQHWPYSTLLLMAGFSMVVFSFFGLSFKKSDEGQE